ncbi:MAG: hypothetical protein H0X24_10620 [Ktedonobacterales bacterium]|nr:hypothetical protein [Ktedonobacterales bacterium]
MRIDLPFRRLLNVFIGLFVGISGVLVYLQATPEAQILTASDYNPRHCVQDGVPQRGTIYDRNGNKLAYSVPDQTQPCGWRRHYTDPTLAPLIGYFDPQGFGTTGLEAAYDDVLSGADAAVVVPAGFNNGVNHILDDAKHTKAYGTDIYLTIDSRIQQKANQVYPNQITCPGQNSAQTGSILVEAPQTGEMLAYISHPGFDNDKLVDHTPAGDGSNLTIGQEYWNALLQDPNRPLINRPVMDAIVPGSSFKTLTFIAALDSQQFTTTSTFTEAESKDYVIDGFNVNTNNLQHYPSIPSSKIFPMDLVHQYAFSNNVAFARLAVAVGKERWLYYAQALGISYGTHVVNIPFDVPVAHSWVFQPSAQAQWDRDDVALANAGYGQAFLQISPLAMTVMTSTIAADGKYQKPHVLLKRVPHGTDAAKATVVAPQLVTQAFSQATAQGLREAMRAVVVYGSVGASGSFVAPPANSPVMEGGKTGTGETGNGSPQTWWISLAPADISNVSNLPRLAIVIQKEQDGEGACQAPIAQSIYEYALPLVGYPLS